MPLSSDSGQRPQTYGNAGHRRVFHVKHFFDGDSGFRSDARLFIDTGIISGILEEKDQSPRAVTLHKEFDNAEHITIPDGLVFPGFINSHHHIYSALARGIPALGPSPDFPSILENLWWRFDRALDSHAVRVSATATALDCIHSGCTAVIDHHSSPQATRGSLQLISDVFKQFHLAGVFCFETTDRNGTQCLQDAIDENLEFAEAMVRHPRFRGMFGLHASFTLSDETLRRIGKIKPAELPVHVHVAEDRCDVEHARQWGFSGALDRLRSYGLLNENSIIAHATYLTDAEIELAAKLGLWIAHNPESNCNNRVGYSDPGRFRSDRVLLGTDGMSSDMLGTLRTAFLLYKSFSKVSDSAFGILPAMLFKNPARCLTALLGSPMGTISEGQPADFAIFTYRSPTPVLRDNFTSHLLSAADSCCEADWVYAGGVPVLEAGKITVVDEAGARQEAREVATHLWKKYQSE